MTKKLINKCGVSLAFILLLISCVYLDSVDYEVETEAGSTAVYTINCRIEPAESPSGEQLIIGFLVPNSWNATEHTVVTYTSSQDVDVSGEQIAMPASLVPSTEEPKNMTGRTWPQACMETYGVGPNVLEEMEWVCFKTDKAYDIQNGGNILDLKVKLEVKVGMQNMRVRLGFLINNSGDGMSGDEARRGTFFTDCIDITNGNGAVIDFCELHLNSVLPLFSNKDDILTITYQGDVIENVLDDYDDLYLNATAYTAEGNEYVVAEQSSKTSMKKLNDYSRNFSLTFWPTEFFNIPANEHVDEIRYVFTNADGSVVLDDYGVPYSYVMSCE
ncbi:MAG: DUF4961 domain-containing protein [Bacteroidales bacterium]